MGNLYAPNGGTINIRKYEKRDSVIILYARNKQRLRNNRNDEASDMYHLLNVEGTQGGVSKTLDGWCVHEFYTPESQLGR